MGPIVHMESRTHEGVTYEVDIEGRSCTCADWIDNRSAFDLEDPRRLCPHLLQAVIEREGNLAAEDPDKPREMTFRRLHEHGNGFPMCRYVESVNLLGWDYDIYFPLDQRNPRIDIFSDDGLYAYNVVETAWDGRNEPVEARALERTIKQVLDEERGRVGPKEKKRLRVTVRAGIVTIISFLVLFTGALVFGLSYYGGRETVGVLMQTMLEDKADTIIEKTFGYLEPAASNALVLADHVEGRDMDTRVEVLESISLMHGTLSAHPQILMSAFANVNGDFFAVHRMPDGSMSTEQIARSTSLARRTWRHENQEFAERFPDSRLGVDEVYDPRYSPWYGRAQTRGVLSWTPVHISEVSGTPALTCAAPVLYNGQLQGVVGVSIGLADLSLFLGDLKVGQSGKAHIVDRDGFIVAMPLDDPDKLWSLVRAGGGSEAPSLRKAVVAPEKAFARSAEIVFLESEEEVTDRILDFDFEGTPYVAMYRNFPRERTLSFPWMIGIVAPESDFMSSVYDRNRIVFFVSLACVLLAVMAGIRLSRIFSGPLDTLVRDMNRIKDFHLSGDRLDSGIIEVHNMGSALENMKTGLRSFRKFVPAALVRDLIALGQEADLGGEHRTISTLFSDIASFTSISEKAEPHSLVQRLGEYMTNLSVIIHQQQGTVDKYIGDSIMAFWNAPVITPDHAFKACRAALECKIVLEALKPAWEKEDIPHFHTRFGIHTGQAIVGNMGSSARLNYTALGDGINLASRLESLNKQYGSVILISEDTFREAGDRLCARLIDMVAVKGKEKPVVIYEPLAERRLATTDQKTLCELFDEGFEHYLAQRFDLALEVYRKAAALEARPGPADVYIRRCELYLQTPPPADWNGVFTATSK